MSPLDEQDLKNLAWVQDYYDAKRTEMWSRDSVGILLGIIATLRRDDEAAS